MTKQLTALAVCALLGGCGSGAKKSFDDSFDKSFQEKFVGSCVQSASNSGVSPELAGKVCTCAADKVSQRFTTTQKMHLTKEQLRPILMECKASIPA